MVLGLLPMGRVVDAGRYSITVANFGGSVDVTSYDLKYNL